jgi:hypothetical protein
MQMGESPFFFDFFNFLVFLEILAEFAVFGQLVIRPSFFRQLNFGL